MAYPKEVTKTIPVPENTGVPGFLRTIEEILKLSNVQRIVVEASGEITYKRYVVEGQPEDVNFNLDLANLQPHHIIRNSDVQEFVYTEGMSAAVVISAMLDAVAHQKLTPIAFATGADTEFFSWYKQSAGIQLQSKDRLFGYQLYFDRAIPDTTLVLCSGHGYTQALVDTRLSVKVEIPVVRFMDEQLEVT